MPLTNSPNSPPYISLNNQLREFDSRSKHFLFSGHYMISHNHFSWQHMDIVRRKLILVTIGTKRVKAQNESLHLFCLQQVSRLQAFSQLSLKSVEWHLGEGGGGNFYLKACRKFKIKPLCDHLTKTEITALFYGNPKQYLNGQIQVEYQKHKLFQ